MVSDWVRIFERTADRVVSVTTDGEVKAFLSGFQEVNQIDYEDGSCAVGVDGFHGDAWLWKPLVVFQAYNSKTTVVVYPK